jgi:hypothetical protein
MLLSQRSLRIPLGFVASGLRWRHAQVTDWHLGRDLPARVQGRFVAWSGTQNRSYQVITQRHRKISPGAFSRFKRRGPRCNSPRIRLIMYKSTFLIVFLVTLFVDKTLGGTAVEVGPHGERWVAHAIEI